LLDQLRVRSEELGRQIASMEKGFEAQYGDAWREHMANQILHPDVIPQREDGESMEDYRARLEKALIAEMLNEDGTIKDEYQTGPYAQWAVWAQKEFNKDYIDQKVEVLSDPNVNEEVKAKEVKELGDNGTLSQINRANADLEANGKSEHSLEVRADEKRDADFNVVVNNNDINAFTSGMG
jgi:hypothetical protein